MNNFEIAVQNLIDKMEEVAAEMSTHPLVYDYFKENYDYNPETDDAVRVLIKYIEDRFC